MAPAVEQQQQQQQLEIWQRYLCLGLGVDVALLGFQLGTGILTQLERGQVVDRQAVEAGEHGLVPEIGLD